MANGVMTSSDSHSIENLEDLVSLAIQATQEGGEVVMHHRGNVTRQNKADGSPVTIADQQAEQAIARHLEPTGIPIVGEEAFEATPPQQIPPTFWLVDALDGTSGYLSGEQDFTVNVGLIHQTKPVLGVVYAPALNRAFGGAETLGAFQTAGTPTAPRTPIHTRPFPKQGITVLTSSRHQLPQEAKQAIHQKLGDVKVAKITPMSSSVKFCLVAAGEADFYLRTSPTMEWDTAAGDAILGAAGGKVELADGTPLSYGKKGFRNNGFYAFGGG